MTVDTAKVSGRRELRFESLDEIAEEAERIVATPQVRTLGNWSIGQIFRHLAAGMHMSIDGSKHRPPWYFRWLGPLVKRRVLTKGMSAGFNLPRPMAATLIVSDDVSAESGLTALRDALRRLKREAHREPHGFFGKLTHQEWEQLHLRHAELHLSFLVPDEAIANSTAEAK